MRGRLYGFRFRDFADFKSCAPGAVVSAEDQALGTGDGVRTRFDLIKRYGEGEEALERRVRKPVAGTVRVAVAGIELGADGFVVDAATGEVTLAVAPPVGAAVTAGSNSTCRCGSMRTGSRSRWRASRPGGWRRCR